MYMLYRVSESRVVRAAQLPAPSYGSLRSEQMSDGMGHCDEPETRYRDIQQHNCIVPGKSGTEKSFSSFNRTPMFPVALGSS